MDNQIQMYEVELTHLKRIAVLHVECFPDSILGKLGRGVVERYYRWQLVGPHEGCHLGAWASGELVGFCFAGRFNGAIGGFVRRHKFYVAIQLLMRPRVWFDDGLREALYVGFKALRGPKRSKKSVNTQRFPSAKRPFGILSLAVSPRYRRAGIGKRLMDAVSSAAMQQGESRIGLTVRPENKSAVDFYLRIGWQKDFAQNPWKGAMYKQL